MLSIQQAGKQILTGNPGKFYIFAGEEYGIKETYLNKIKVQYKEYIEVDSISEVLDIMRSKHIIPLVPTLYVARYDESFIQNLNEKVADKIKSTNVIGTIVGIYQSSKHFQKCNKFLSDYTISFDRVNPEFIYKYLKSDFPGMKDAIIRFAIKIRPDYKGAWNICNSLSYLDSIPANCTELELSSTLGCSNLSSEGQFRQAFASRNYPKMVAMLDTYPDVDSLYYTMLNTLIELDKVKSSSYAESDIRSYSKSWDTAEIYNMFNHIYSELKKVRTFSSYKVMISIMYILAITQYSPIPPLEVLV